VVPGSQASGLFAQKVAAWSGPYAEVSQTAVYPSADGKLHTQAIWPDEVTHASEVLSPLQESK